MSVFTKPYQGTSPHTLANQHINFANSISSESEKYWSNEGIISPGKVGNKKYLKQNHHLLVVLYSIQLQLLLNLVVPSFWTSSPLYGSTSHRNVLLLGSWMRFFSAASRGKHPFQPTFGELKCNKSPDILLMEEILHHLGCIKPCK